VLSREERYLANNLAAAATGNPFAQMPRYRAEPVPTFTVRALNDRWRYLGKPVEVGQIVSLPLDECEGLVSLRRAEFTEPERVREHYRNRRR
jgi:hypothetical protein